MPRGPKMDETYAAGGNAAVGSLPTGLTPSPQRRKGWSPGIASGWGTPTPVEAVSPPAQFFFIRSAPPNAGIFWKVGFDPGGGTHQVCLGRIGQAGLDSAKHIVEGPKDPWLSIVMPYRADCLWGNIRGGKN